MPALNLFGSAYGLYSNVSTPGSMLHEAFSLQACQKRARDDEQKAKAARKTPFEAGAALTHARRCANQGAVAGALAFKVVDAVVGTGLHPPGRVDLRSVKDVRQHAQEVLQHFCNTGLLGMTALTIIALPMVTGGALGYGLGATLVHLCPINRSFVGWAATVGALGAAALCVVTLPGEAVVSLFGLLFLLGAARAATGLGKMVTVAVGSGLGFAVGLIIARLRGHSILAQKPAASPSLAA